MFENWSKKASHCIENLCVQIRIVVCIDGFNTLLFREMLPNATAAVETTVQHRKYSGTASGVYQAALSTWHSMTSSTWTPTAMTSLSDIDIRCRHTTTPARLATMFSSANSNYLARFLRWNCSNVELCWYRSAATSITSSSGLHVCGKWMSRTESYSKGKTCPRYCLPSSLKDFTRCCYYIEASLLLGNVTLYHAVPVWSLAARRSWYCIK